MFLVNDFATDLFQNVGHGTHKSYNKYNCRQLVPVSKTQITLNSQTYAYHFLSTGVTYLLRALWVHVAYLFTKYVTKYRHVVRRIG